MSQWFGVEITTIGLVAALVGGLLVGFAKTGMPGIGLLTVPLLALTFPTKLSVGAVLPMLITGDIVAVIYYHHHARWDRIVPLIPWVLGGIVAGWAVLPWFKDRSLAVVLGLVILALLSLELLRARLKAEAVPRHVAFIAATGFLAGFTTMIGNVAGPIMAIFFLSQRLDKNAFMGSSAWYFLLLNCIKVPFSVSLGMITLGTLAFNACCVPVIVGGALGGAWLLPRIPQKLFNRLVLVLAAVGAVLLIAKGLWPVPAPQP